jgi:hypothetical protein
MECAIGMTGDDGVSYGLQSDDPASFSSTPTGQKIKITGELTQTSSVYDIAGTIKVQSLQQL